MIQAAREVIPSGLALLTILFGPVAFIEWRDRRLR
jgi:hypothetical protein